MITEIIAALDKPRSFYSIRKLVVPSQNDTGELQMMLMRHPMPRQIGQAFTGTMRSVELLAGGFLIMVARSTVIKEASRTGSTARLRFEKGLACGGPSESQPMHKQPNVELVPRGQKEMG